MYSQTNCKRNAFTKTHKNSIIVCGRNSRNGSPFVIVKLANPQDNKTVPLL